MRILPGLSILHYKKNYKINKNKLNVMKRWKKFSDLNFAHCLEL